MERKPPAGIQILSQFSTPCCRLQREEPFHFPRLFECSNQTGHFRITEVYDFAQSDLDEEDVMLLDTWEEVRGHLRRQSNTSTMD